MNLSMLQEYLSGLRDLVILGRDAEIDGLPCSVIGAARLEGTWTLLAAVYDEQYAEREEEWDSVPHPRRTNRDHLRYSVAAPQMPHILSGVRSVVCGGRECPAGTSSVMPMDFSKWETTALLCELLRRGWTPPPAITEHSRGVFLCTAELETDGVTLPLRLRFGQRTMPRPQLVELPLTLHVGGPCPETILFGGTHWVKIHNAYLYDIRAEMETAYTPQQLEGFRPGTVFGELCPAGMRLPVVEYECEDGVSIQWHARAWLDAEAVESDHAVGILMGRGRACIQYPVPPDTAQIEVELFSFEQIAPQADIFLQ